MAHKKAGGKTKNGRDSNPKYLGVKLYEGEMAGIGSIIIRQRGTDVLAGRGVAKGKDDTLFAMRAGKVVFSTKRKVGFNSKMKVKKVVSVV